MRVLFIDHTTGLKSLDDFKTQGRGGMVSSLRILPDVLSQLNISCAVLSDIEQGGKTPAGVVWYTRKDWDCIEGREWDAIVFNRTVQNGFPELKARHRILWTHDLVHGGWIRNPKTIKAFAATVFMSEYSEKTWRFFYPGIGKSFLIPNGVDKKLFYPREKDLRYLIFASAPNRGIDRVGLFFEALKTRVSPDLYCRAFSDLKAMHPQDAEKQPKFDDSFEQYEGWQDLYRAQYKNLEEAGVERPGCVPQADLAEELGRAGLMIIPSGYPEQCSNSVLQALASGTPVVTTGIGASPEWVRHGWNGMVTRWHLEDYMAYHREFYNHCKTVLTNEKLHRKLIGNAPRTKNLFTWEEIGERWASMLRKIS